MSWLKYRISFNGLLECVPDHLPLKIIPSYSLATSDSGALSLGLLNSYGLGLMRQAIGFEYMLWPLINQKKENLPLTSKMTHYHQHNLK